MGSIETGTELDCSVRVDTVTVAVTVDRERFVSPLDAVGDGGCVSGIVDDNGGNTGIKSRNGTGFPECPANCLSGNGCHSYGCGETADLRLGYHPPFRTDSFDFTDSENYRGTCGIDGVNEVDCGFKGQVEKKEFGVLGFCSNDSDVENRSIDGNGLENPYVDGELQSTSPGSSGITCIVSNEKKEADTDCLDDPYLAGCQGDGEEKGHGSSGISSELPTGENVYGLLKGSPEIASYDLAEGLATPLSCFFGVAGSSCSKYLCVSNNYERCGVSGLTCCSSSIGGSSGLKSDDGRSLFERGTMLEANDANVGPSSSSMITRASKSNRLTRTRRAAWQCSQTVASSSGLGNTLWSTSNKIRGKRSSFCKPARLSIWGELGSLVQIFDQNSSIPKFTLSNSCHDIGLLGRQSKVINNRGSAKKRGGVGRRTCQKTKVGGSFKKLKCRASTNWQRSKVKMEGHWGKKGSRSLCPEVDSLDGIGLKPVDAGSLSSLVENPIHVGIGSYSKLEIECKHNDIKNRLCEPHCQLNLEGSESAREVAHKLEADGSAIEQVDQLVVSMPAEEFRYSLDGNSGRPIMALDVSVLDSPHEDKDMESTVTVEALTEYTLGDCQDVSPPASIEASKEAIVNKELELGLFPALEGFSLFPEKAAIVGEVTVSTCQKSRARKGKKDEKAKADPHILAGAFPLGQKMLDPVSLEKSGKPAKSRTVKNARNTKGPKAALKSSASKNDSGKAPGSEGFSMETSLSDITDVRVTRENVKLEMALEAPALSGQGPFGIMLSAAAVLDGLLPMRKRKGPTLPKKTTTASRKSRSHGPDSAESRKANARAKKKENMDNKVSEREVEEKEILHEFHFKDKIHTHNVSSCLETGMCSEPRTFIELSENDLVAKDALQEMGGLRGSKEISCKGMSASVMFEGGDNLASSKSGEGSDVQCLLPRVAWVLCDDCQKWRCIPAELADIIGETDCRWTCKDNTDKTFADCSIPQEKSNAEINAELNISDEDSCSVLPCFKGSESKQSTSSQQASWTLIKSNLFLHRSRRTQTIDEIMVCQCKPPLGGSMGCGDECLNRMLNIECVRGTCPCGDLCSNQQFQRHKYANFKWFRCGKKGYGLKLQEDVSQGAFLIEYVGEVLDLHAYEARQHDYASKGQRHFYFMTLNGSEVIDACAKGNLGRFINHSCDPNCRTEKWMVNGEVCIGLFALRDIQKGEEVTFDYNYVRVFGAAAKKCVCGSSECRGYIGGDPSSTEVVRVDSDDDYPESIMIHEDGRIEHLVEEKILDSSLLDVVAVPQGDHLDENKISDSGVLDVALPQRKHFQDVAVADASFPVPVTIPQEEHFEEEKIPDTSLSDFDVPHGEICLQTTQIKSQTLSDPVDDNLTISKPCPSHMKSPCVSSSIKKGRCIDSKIKAIKPKKLVAGSESSHSDGVDAKHTDVKFTKHKKIVAGAESSRIEGVEEKLNEVLDAEGGISKRKDATKGYLKLLLVTAASGDNIKGEAFQSTRDLSIVLDALLKTKSRMVLVDIVNKNGLQMLHNMIKQNRRNFNKTPIIRKLLKVLEFLAVKEILTLEQINAGPLWPGMESFRDSIFILTRHNDTQVQHIARSFRDKWMPRSLRKLNVSDREDAEFSHRSGHWKESSASHKYWQGRSACHTNATNSLTQKLPTVTPLDADSPTSQTSPSPTLHGSAAISTTDGNPRNVPKQRKRKSRWDQPTEVATGAESEPQQNTKRIIIERSTSPVEPSIWVPEGCEVSQNQIMMVRREENDCSGFNGHNLHTSIQPLLNAGITNRVPYFPSPACNEVVMGQPQVKFLPNLPVSYGIPLPLVQQLGTYHQGAGGDGRSSPGWAIAPAVPFHPFPPLPPLPPPSQQSSTMLPSQRKHGEEAQADNCARNHHMESATPTVSGTTASETVAFNSTRSSQSHERGKWSSGGLGRRSFRQQKWSPQGYPKTPPWVWHQNIWTSRGNWKHGGFSCAGNATNKMGSMDQGDHSFRRTTGGAGWRPSDDRGGKNIGDDY